LHFHAAAEGVEAWNQLQKVLDAPQTQRGNAVLTGAIHLEWDHLTAEFDNHSIEIPDGKVESGSITVIEGPSGCGKSTLLGIILGSITTFRGRISLINNGQEFSPIDLDSRNLHSAIGYVGQNAWLGEGSVREAISPPNRRVTSVELESMLHSLALNIPLNTRISDRSQGVSVGQRRRLAIARELLRNPQLLILDEPAAALDEESEQAVMEVLRRYADDGHAVLVVAHRTSVIEAADVVVSFSKAGAR
jgi:ATP-binding cassette subfamily C protein CydD